MAEKRSPFEETRFEYCLPEDLVEKARVELGEDPDTVAIQIEKFRQKVKGIKNLNPRLDDCFLVSFLRAKKFNQDKALRALKRYYDLKKNIPQYCFPLMMPSENMQLFQEGEIFTILKEKDNLGRTIAIVRLGNIDPLRMTREDIARCLTTNLEVMMMDQRLQIGGLVLIADFTNLGKKQLKLLSIKVIKSLCLVVMDTYPIRFRLFHGLNTPSYFDTLYQLFRPFISKKIQKRLNPHGKKTTHFDENIPLEILPAIYGGKVKGFDNSWLLRHIEELEEPLKDLSNYGYRCEKKSTTKEKPKRSNSEEELAIRWDALLGDETEDYLKNKDAYRGMERDMCPNSMLEFEVL